MSSETSRSPRDDYFNDLSQRSPNASESPKGGENNVQSAAPLKRIACILCRKRKLRCDSKKPSCGTCSRLGHACSYDEVRKKSGPKRGYVKVLEARLKQVETLLGTQTPTDTDQPATKSTANVPEPTSYTNSNPAPESVPAMVPPADYANPSLGMMDDFGINNNGDFSWEMIGLGLEEPLPRQDIIDDMTQIYFEKVHPSLPMIHRPRFLAAMDLAPHMRPPICLRYAMWTMVCSITPRYDSLKEHFYGRSRKYAEMDEMKGHGESMITLAHAQCWSLLAAYEFKMMYFPRAWMSSGRATRLCQMMGLHRLDGGGLDVKQCLAPPRDWTEREERRRTFWQAFCHDRYASIGTGWPMIFDEQDILTNLPANEEAFIKSKPERTLSLTDAMTADGASTLSPLAGVVLMACLFGRNLTHLHRPNEEDRDNDLNGEFWKRHRQLDNILLNTSLSLPSQLRLPAGIHDTNIVFCNMNIHTSTICLHQAAIYKADKNRMPPQISAESKRRCIIAADQITNIMKMICHLDLSSMNPFLAFCLYVAARCFFEYLKARRDDATVKSSLEFLLSAMQALKAKNPLTESFLVQLEVDLEGSGLQIPTTGLSHHRHGPFEVPVNFDTLRCSPIFEIRESQAHGQNGPPVPEQRKSTRLNDHPMNYSQFGQNNGPPSTASLPNRPRLSPQASLSGMRFSGDAFQNTISTVMDLSPDTSAAEQHSSQGPSNHPTPSTSSNKGSSHAPFTPPHFEDNASTIYSSSSNGMPSGSGTAQFYQNAESFNKLQSEINKDGPSEMQNPFSYSASWDYSSDGPANTGAGVKDPNPTEIAPGPSGMTSCSPGMTPMTMSDGSWPGMNILEGQDWMFSSDWNPNSLQP